MLLRRKSTADDEYHHADTVGVFGVITGANGAVMSSSVYDAFIAPQYVQGGTGTQRIARCYLKAPEPMMLTGNGGRGVYFPARGFKVLGHKYQNADGNETCGAGPSVLTCLNACMAILMAWDRCALLCLQYGINGKCNWLFFFCMRLPEQASEECMLLYDTICQGY